MRLSHGTALAVTLALPFLAGCTVNNPPASPVIVQERVAVPAQTIVTQPPVVLQRY